MQAVVIVAVRRDACVRLAPLAWTAAPLYTIGAYSEAQFYAHGQGSARLWAGCAAWALAVAYLAAELRK